MPWRSCLFLLFLRNRLVKVGFYSIIPSFLGILDGSSEASLDVESS